MRCGDLRALFVHHYPAFGGPQNRVLRLAPPLAQKGWTVSIVLPTEEGNAAPRLRSAGVDVIQTPLGRLRRVRDPRPNLTMLSRAPHEIWQLRQIIRATQASVVIVGNLLMPHGAIAARLEGRAVLWQIVDTTVPPVLQLGVMPMVRILADALAYGGASLPSQHVGARRLPQPAFVVPPPVDTRTFVADATARAAVREELAIPPDAPLVGQVANINPTKGLDGFLRAAALVRRSIPRARFVIVGSVHDAHASYFDALQRLQGQLDLDTSMLWIGDRGDVERYYAAMDVFVVSSLPRSEGTTTTAMEALACCVPVVATDVGAIHEVVIDGMTGRPVPPESPNALASAIVALLRDETFRRTLGSAGRQHVVENFDLELCAGRYVDAFTAAIDHQARRGGRWRQGRYEGESCRR